MTDSSLTDDSDNSENENIVLEQLHGCIDVVIVEHRVVVTFANTMGIKNKENNHEGEQHDLPKFGGILQESKFWECIIDSYDDRDLNCKSQSQFVPPVKLIPPEEYLITENDSQNCYYNCYHLAGHDTLFPVAPQGEVSSKE